MTIWDSLPRPFFVLAPMEDVTDTVFRHIVISCGRPDLFFTEFTNVEGMLSEGNKIVSQRLLFSEPEHPIIAQIWGKDPEHYYEAAKRIKRMGYDGIDINMGCPEKSVVKNGCCAALIKNPSLAQKIIEATKDGAEGLPVSVKTRLGYDNIVTEEWITFLLKQDISALTIHGRTAKELSLVPAHWDEIKKAVDIRNNLKLNTLIIGNGDILSRDMGEEKAKETGVDGIMIGRGIFHDPYVFSKSEKWENKTLLNKLELLEKHIHLYQEIWGDTKHFAVLKKFVKMYISGFDGASEVRVACMEAENYDALLHVTSELKSAQHGKA